MRTIQALPVAFCIGFISTVLSEPIRQSKFVYREMFRDTSHRINRRGAGGDIMHVPDGTWDTEKNYTLTHPERSNKLIRQVGSDLPPPSAACIRIKPIYDNGFNQAAGGAGGAAAALRAILEEGQNILSAKFTSANQLGTSFTFTVDEPVYDQSNTFNANGETIYGSGVESHIITASHEIDHYAFFGGAHAPDALGVAFLGTACIRAPQDQKYKVSITHWFGDMAGTAGVFAHELGHALGLEHDFIDGSGADRYDRNGVKCTDINGVMDYGSRSTVDKWSTCSKQDFRDWHNQVLHFYNEFCLVCDGTNPPEPTDTPDETTTEDSTGTGRCDGTDPNNIRQCCTFDNPCEKGEGDCNQDWHCAPGLQCGDNNCLPDFSTTTTDWKRGHDCCFEPDPNNTPAPITCDGASKQEIKRCCRTNGPCDEGQGECNNDRDCAGDLICGTDNCQADGISGGKWNRRHDCCIRREESFYVDDGCHSESDEAPDDVAGSYQPKSYLAGVRCCGRMWGTRTCATVGNCPADFTTYDDAVSKCASEGGRPCTKEELLRDVCCGTGGMCDNYPVWTSTNDSGDTTVPTDAPTTTNGPNPTTTPSDCGVKPAGIVGGDEVNPFSIPWQVAVVFAGENAGSWCGGTLITDRHVLTAAHCMYSVEYDVIVGEHHVSQVQDGVSHRVCKLRVHPNYNGNTLSNDFAILTLRDPVQLGTRVTKACLPPTRFGGDFLAGKTLTASGWGALQQGGGGPDVLHSVDVPGLTNAQCNSLPAYSGQIEDNMLCAGDLSGGKDSCQGDSGGPLTYTENGKTYVAGVVSWGYGCAKENQPGVYSRVTEVLDWINSELTSC